MVHDEFTWSCGEITWSMMNRHVLQAAEALEMMPAPEAALVLQHARLGTAAKVLLRTTANDKVAAMLIHAGEAITGAIFANMDEDEVLPPLRFTT